MNRSALSTRHSAFRVHAALATAALLFSANYIVSKLAMRAFNPLVFAYYVVLSKPVMARLSARRVIARMFAVACAMMLPVAAWPLAHERWSSIPPRAWIALALVVAGPTVAAYLLNAWALRHAD